jgi:hypothetical protein
MRERNCEPFADGYYTEDLKGIESQKARLRNGKNADILFFYAFVMLDDKDLTCVSRSLEDGVGTSEGFGTAGGGKMVTDLKKMEA